VRTRGAKKARRAGTAAKKINFRVSTRGDPARAAAIATFFVHRCITGFNAYTRVGKYVDMRVAAIAARAARRKFIAFIARARSHDSPTRESREIARGGG
jgi:hypothetical protein